MGKGGVGCSVGRGRIGLGLGAAVGDRTSREHAER